MLEKIYNFFDYGVIRPQPYGIYHIFCFITVIIITVLLCKKYHNCTEKTLSKIALIMWIIMIVLEIYKQIIYSVSLTDGVFVWDYQWYIFPFQFCSTPFYVLPMIAFLPEGKARDAAICFLGTFSLIAGIAVYFAPNDVFIKTVGINIQTMVHPSIITKRTLA